jgi:hypothetical protein
VAGVPEDPIVHLRLDLSQHEGTVFGRFLLQGATDRAFTGWVGLNAAVDVALGTERQRHEFHDTDGRRS